MKSTVCLSSLCGVLGTLLIITAACSSSRKANRDDDESDSGSQSYRDGAIGRDRDADYEADDDDRGDDDDDDDGDSRTKKSTGGSGGSAGSAGGDGPYREDASDSVRCDDDGYCYWPDGHWCDPSGTCCYPDGHCERATIETDEGQAGTVATGGAGGVFVVPPPFGGVGGSSIDPDDFTDEPWNPPIDDLGEPRWRNSGESLCTEMHNDVTTHSVWSDSRGVYVLVSGASIGETTYEIDSSLLPPGFPPIDTLPPGLVPPFGKCIGEGCPRVEIYFNDGNGWDSVYQEEGTVMGPFSPGEMRLTGFKNGPLLLYGEQGISFPFGVSSACGLATIENGVKTCEPINNVDDLFVVNSDLAYGIYNGEVIRYNGSSWGPLPGAMSNNWINQIWADEAHLFGTTDGAGRIIELRDGTWSLLDTGTLLNFYAIWGFSESDLWAGTYEENIFHCDEEGCSELSWPGEKCEYTSGIREIWGSDGVVYFYTDSTIARIVDSEVEILASFPCPDYEYEYQEVPRITSMWGNGPNEVFFTIVDESFPRRECGVTYVVWFDGNEFHRF
ncbi:MAG: hypothetical protein JXA30_12525 [Deltaproteobacteria bacterium]|nr:hypothetical protein [Deltaproteobacteria bacterium]